MNLGLERSKVKLVEHDPQWANIFEEEKTALKNLLNSSNLLEIHHIGSTSIPGIVAKPVMGILVVVQDLASALTWQPVLQIRQYHLTERGSDHALFAKDSGNKRIMNLYIAQAGSDYAFIALLFRDYLLSNPKTAREYEALKIELAKKYPNERQKYVEGKNPFIEQVIQTAKEQL